MGPRREAAFSVRPTVAITGSCQSASVPAVSARTANLTAGTCLALTAFLEVQLLRRHRAFDLFLSGPVAHADPYRVGATLGLPGLLLLLIGCVILLALVISRAETSTSERVLAGLAALPVAACAFLVHPFSSRAFVVDRRHDAVVGIALLAVSALALGGVTLVELARMRRSAEPVESGYPRTGQPSDG